MAGKMQNNIAQIRRQKGMTQLQLATCIGKKRHTVAEYELGVINIPLSVLYDIAMALEVSVATLLPAGQVPIDPLIPVKRGRPSTR